MTYGNRGLVYYNKGDYIRATTDYDEAIRLDPTNPVTFANRGLARQAKGEHDAAVADFRSALKLNPQDLQKYRELLDAAEKAKRQSKQ